MEMALIIDASTYLTYGSLQGFGYIRFTSCAGGAQENHKQACRPIHGRGSRYRARADPIGRTGRADPARRRNSLDGCGSYLTASYGLTVTYGSHR